jgi:hypothetical protein
MADVILPDDVRDFILGHIDSVAELEALLLLRNHAEQSWTIAEAAKRLYVSEAMAAEALARLAADGLCICSDEFYRYHPSSEEQGMTIDRLSEAYARYLIPVTHLVHNKPARIRKFADAFRFRRDK